MARVKDYPFPDIGHNIMLQKAPDGYTGVTLDDIINKKVTLALGPTAACRCGVSVPIPGGSIEAYARGIKEKLGGATNVVFGVAHNMDGKLSTEEATEKINAWYDKHKNDPAR